MRPLIALLLALAVAFSGCASDSKDKQDPGTGDGGSIVNNTTVGPKVFKGGGYITASAGGVSFTPPDDGVAFDVAGGATLLFAEIAWDDPVQDLHLALSSPSSEGTAGSTTYDHVATGGAPGDPDSPHSLTLTSPEVGAWLAGATSNGGGGQIEYRLAATVFYGETSVPDGYSAL